MSLIEMTGVDRLYDSRKLVDMNKLWEYPEVVSCGAYHCTALKSDGTLVSWGSNDYGQVTNTPTGNNFIQVSCGNYHCTALKSDGTLVSWGYDYYLQVTNTPIGNGFVQVSCGQYHCTALKSDGTLVSWGSNDYGQVTNTPTGNNFIQVSCGAYHCTALKSDGTLVSWGREFSGSTSNTPTGNTYVQVSCGSYHCTALKSDGTLVSWGYEYRGSVINTPTGNNFVQVSCGATHCTALKSDGTLVSWGYNYTGGSVNSTPTGNNFVQVSCGVYHCTALKSDGTLVSWGYNDYGQVTNTPTGYICRFRTVLLLIKGLLNIKTIFNNTIIDTGIFEPLKEIDFMEHGIGNLSHLNNVLITSKNIELLQLTKSSTSTPKSVVNIEYQPVNFIVKVNTYTSPLTPLIDNNLLFTIPKEHFILGDNNVTLEVISQDGTMTKNFSYIIIKEDRDTFILNRRLERDESHILNGDLSLSAGTGVIVNGLGKGEVVIEIPTIGKSSIKKITGTTFTESTHVNSVTSIIPDTVNINGVGYDQGINKGSIKELVKSITFERGE